MSSDALTTYLQDHLAGAIHAIELLKAMRDHFAGEPLGAFAAEMLAEIESDRDLLAKLTKRVGGSAGGRAQQRVRRHQPRPPITTTSMSSGSTRPARTPGTRLQGATRHLLCIS